MVRIFLVVFFSLLASLVQAEGYEAITLEFDTQRNGGDYTQFRVSSAQECARECERSSQCQAFDFYSSDHSCWLKSAAYPARKSYGVVSGAKNRGFTRRVEPASVDMSISYDTQRAGADYTRFQAQDVHQCSQRCSRDSRCAAFDYTTSDYFCYLKSWIPSSRRYRGIHSGVKRRYFPQVKSVQEILIQRRYNPGPADGVMGNQTRIALEYYQRDHQLYVTGRIDDPTLVSMGLLQPLPAPPVVQAVAAEPPPASKPAAEPEVEKERWSAEPEAASREVATPPADASAQGDLLLYVNTVGVTYLQMKDNIYADILARIPAGIKLKVLLEKGEWYKVSYQNQVGYVLAESVAKL